MSSQVKRAYVHGVNTIRTVNPAGNNYIANFARGVGLYFDPDIKAKRTAVIENEKAAAKAYFLQTL